ncbi:sialin-like isoform X1 [Portunus trituberculatus]|uniref:sialin-like isoform X1 n=1 Tax=Portunus trituberculatus TaxID=210409 RepID=UPI001E1CF069|nr:sialin-like isoform X1 [Portunus trituberculatus]
MDDSKKKCSEEAPRRALKPVPQITLSEAPDIDQNSDECIVVPPSPPPDIAEEKTPAESEDKSDKVIPDEKDKENTAPDKPKAESAPKVTASDNNKSKNDTTPIVTDKSAKDDKDSAPVKSSDKPKDKTEKPDKVDSTADKPDNNVKAKPESSPKPPGKDSSADKLPDKTDSKANDKPVKPDTTTTTTTTKPSDTTDKPDKPADKKTDTTTTTTTTKPTQTDTTTTTTTTNTTKPTEKKAEPTQPTETTPKPATNASQPDKKESNATKTDAKEDQGKEKGSEATKPVPKATDEGKGAADGKAQDGGGGGHEEEESVPFNGEEETIPLRTKEVEEKEGEEKKNIVPSRVIFAVLGCIGFMIVYGLKVNLSVAIIAMVNHTAVAHAPSHDTHEADNMTLEVSDGHGNDSEVVDDCGRKKTKEALEDGPFAWDENVQGLILASYFYGYLFTQVPGGWVAEKFSAKHVFGVGALINAICAILSPIAAKGSYIWLIVIRIIMGIAGGVTLPGMHVLIAKWAPPQERSKIASGVYAGMTLGTLVCMPFSGFLAASLDWSAVFYVQGGLSLLWYVLWLIFVYDSPAQHPRISRAEKKYIEESLGTVVKTEKPAVPWKSVWTSMPVWAIIVAHTCSNWGWYMLLVKLPTYMRYILKFDIKSNAALSAVPFLCMWIFTMLLANILDALRSRGFITTTFARKLATFFASVPPSVCLIGVTYVGCNTDLAVALLTLGTMFVGGMYSGFLSNHIDIAPPFAGTLMGITNTFATLPGIIVPSFVGFMTHGNQTVEAWRTIFFITLAIFLFEAIFYTIFGSGEQQEWSKPKPQPQEGEQQKLNDMP